MKLFVNLALAAGALLAGAAARAQDGHVAPAQSPATTIDAAPFRRIEAFLDGYVAAHMADKYPPGIMVAVVTPAGVFTKTYGVADVDSGAPATPDTLFRIASISKTFIWTSVMILVDEGKIDLDADVNQYLKGIKVARRFGAPVTMNDLMAHRAGFEDTLGDFFESRSGRTTLEALKRHAPKRVAPPGQRTSYSNWGSDLAAQIVEDVSGVPYDEFVRTRILAPLGMASTTLHGPPIAKQPSRNDEKLDARFASPHKLDAGAPMTMPHDEIEPLYAAGAMALDAGDAATWMKFFIDGGAYDGRNGRARLLSPQAFAVMRTRAFRDRVGAPDFAHGFMEAEIAGVPTFGHGGTLSGFISTMTVAPSLRAGVFVVANAAEQPRLPDLVARAVIEEIADADSFDTATPQKPAEAVIAAAKDVAGVYVGNRRSHSRFEKFLAVGQDVVIAARDDGGLVVAGDGVVKRYFPLADGVWTDRSRDRLVAIRDDDGAVVRISASAGTNSYERVGFLGSSNGFLAGVGLALLFAATTLLGAWRRQGRDVQTTDEGARLALGVLAVALAWFAFAGAGAYAMASLSDKELPDFVAMGWPPAGLIALNVAAYVAAIAAILNALAIVPAWTRSGWSIWRMLHHLLFALAGLFGLYALWRWNLILAPMTTV